MEDTQFIVWDLETTGLNVWFDVPLTGAFVLCDQNLNIKDKFTFKCKLPQGVVPSPIALLVNNIDPQTIYEGESYINAMEAINKKCLEWGPSIFLGYNNIGYDDKLLRMGLFKSLLPQYLTNTNGNSRTDLLTIMHNVHLFAPNTISIPMTAEGKPTFKLEELAKVNGIKHEAHAALGDVLATISLSKMVKERAPDIWQAALVSSSKKQLLQQAEDMPIFCHGKFNIKREPEGSIYTYMLVNPKMNNELLGFNLKYDPSKYFDLGLDSMEEMVRATKGPFVLLKANESPLLMNSDYISNLHKQPKKEETYLKRAYAIRNNISFKANAALALERTMKHYKKSDLLEYNIYNGFCSDDDKILMQRFHEESWDYRADMVNKFSDDRLNKISEMYMYHEKPDLLDSKIRRKIDYILSSRITSVERQRWRTIDNAINELNKIQLNNSYPAKKTDAIEDLLHQISKKHTTMMEKNTSNKNK